MNPLNISLLKVHQAIDSSTLLRSLEGDGAQLQVSTTTQDPIEIVESTEEILKCKKELEQQDVIGT